MSDLIATTAHRLRAGARLDYSPPAFPLTIILGRVVASSLEPGERPLFHEKARFEYAWQAEAAAQALSADTSDAFAGDIWIVATIDEAGRYHAHSAFQHGLPVQEAGA
jgi:hypothetical protein